MEKKDRLRALRILNGLTQSDLAGAAGLRQPAIASFELGKYSLKDAAARRLADALGVDPAYLLCGRPVPEWLVWAPKGGRSQIKSLLQDIEILFPQFWRENGFVSADLHPMIDGALVRLASQKGGACLVLIPQFLVEILLGTMKLADVVICEHAKKETVLDEITPLMLMDLDLADAASYQWQGATPSLFEETLFKPDTMLPILKYAFEYIFSELDRGAEEYQRLLFANHAAQIIGKEILDRSLENHEFTDVSQLQLENALKPVINHYLDSGR
jgi:transcriptional regulator with XRE-family HTH domain